MQQIEKESYQTDLNCFVDANSLFSVIYEYFSQELGSIKDHLPHWRIQEWGSWCTNSILQIGTTFYNFLENHILQ